MILYRQVWCTLLVIEHGQLWQRALPPNADGQGSTSTRVHCAYGMLVVCSQRSSKLQGGTKRVRSQSKVRVAVLRLRIWMARAKHSAPFRHR